MTSPATQLQARIEAASIPVTECGCWIWLGAERIKGRGYGAIAVDGKNINAHRASWMAFNGAMPNNLHVLHRCDTPACVNPDHLFLGTNRDNMADKATKGRTSKLAGVNNPRVKLTSEQVTEVRASTESNGAVARRFGVARATIWKIKNQKSWRPS